MENRLARGALPFQHTDGHRCYKVLILQQGKAEVESRNE